MTSPSITYSVVIPCYRSHAWLGQLVERLEQVFHKIGESFEIILVNDASPDQTWTTIAHLATEHNSVHGIDLLFNVGQFRATLCGMEQARGRYVLTMDDDLQHPPEEIPLLINKMQQSPDCDCVIGAFPTPQQSAWRRWGSRFSQKLNAWFYGKPPELKLSAFRLMTRITAAAICAHGTIRPVIGPLLLKCTKRIVNVDVRHDPRPSGQSGYSLSKLVRAVIDYIVAGTTVPLKFFSALGLFVSSISCLLICYYLVMYLANEIREPGFTTLVLLVTFFGGTILLAVGTLGEYVIRVVQETSKSPRYIIRIDTKSDSDNPS
ncbi:MAG: glycosyltransferase family 2 protein [Planctomycetaceae bacterium]|nr:glycosyltransferase family 2 protein [Planctomycetaceae bacterium]